MTNFWQRVSLRLAKALNLDLTHAQVRYAGVVDSLVRPGESWLEIGCGRQILPTWVMGMDRQKSLAARASLLVGMDLDPAIRQHPLLNCRVMATGSEMPFAADTFSLLTANTVVEHVGDPDRFISEVHRVLKDGGRFLFHTPNRRYYLVFLASLTPDVLKRQIVWLLERRRDEDIFPTYYRLNTTSAICRIAKSFGLEVEQFQLTGPTGAFRALGPLGWMECILLKMISIMTRDRYKSNLIVVLRKPEASGRKCISLAAAAGQ